MYRIALTLICTIALLAPASLSKAIAQDNADIHTPTTPTSFSTLAEKLLPAVVNISSTQKAPQIELEEIPGIPQEGPEAMPRFPEGSPFEHFFEDFLRRRGGPMRMEPQASLGSGFIIDAEKGYIITNNHVIKDAEEVRVTFHDDETVDAEIIGRDEKTDLAVLQVKTDKKLTAVSFGNSDLMRVGDWIVAIGNPFGLGGTVTAGIISARARDISSGPYDDFIQTDASINRGNSGGPMFNLSGKVIGINTAIFSPSGGSVGIGFAIPSSLAKPILDQIIQYGRTRRGWLGVRIQHVTDEIAESLGLTDTSGALIASVTEGGPSEAAGLKIGDVILALNGKKVNEMRELPRLVAETTIGSSAQVDYWRDGKRHMTTVTIGELEKAEEDGLITAQSSEDKSPSAPKGEEIEELGVKLAELNDTTRNNFGIDKNVKGVVITSITPRSEAEKKGLYEGDVVVEINQKPITKPENARKVIDSVKKDKRGSVLLLINREGEARFIALKIEENKKEQKKAE